MNAPLKALCAFVFLCSFAPGLAASQVDTARRLFSEGAAAMDEGRFADARDKYRASLDMEANAGTAFNLAVALTRTGEYVEAVSFFTRLTDGAFGPISGAQRREVRSLRAGAEEGIATLTIQVPPAEGIDVRIDGVSYDGPLRTDPGEHVVTVQSERHEVFEERVQLRRGEERTFQPTLRQRADANLGHLIVRSIREDAIVEIEGVADGVGGLDLMIEEGHYEVVVRSDGQSRTHSVDVEAQETARYTFDWSESSRRPWLWVLGGVLVAGAAATALGLVLTREDDPRSDPTYGTIQTLTPSWVR